jgi:type II secretory pathway pseudopilin PulG
MRATNRRGSSLLEVMMASVIVLIAMAPLAQLVIQSAAQTSRSSFNVQAAAFAREMISARTLGDVTDTGPTGCTLVSGTFPSGISYEGFVWVTDPSGPPQPCAVPAAWGALSPALAVPVSAAQVTAGYRYVEVRVRRASTREWYTQTGYAFAVPP